MEIKNIIDSAKFLEFTNAIDDLVLEILYDTNDGYVNYASKKAIIEAQNKIKYFDDNTIKLQEEYKLSEIEDIVKEKRENLISVMKKHLEEQTYTWCEEVYENCIENCITSIAINRDNKKIADKNLQKVISIIEWIANIKNLSDKEKNDLFDEFYDELNKAVKTNDFKIQKEKTDSNETKFLELFFKISEKDFLNLNLAKYENFLTKEDMNYFHQIQINLNTFKQSSIIDENDLIKSGIDVLNLKNNKEKYEFIKSVLNEFNLFKFENKKITNNDKIAIIKERIAIFKDKVGYFRNKIR